MDYSYISLVVSILAIIGTVYTYCKHDKKIKEQELFLNEYTIKKIKEEELNRKKALIEGRVDLSKATGILKIVNNGKSDAKNISVVIENTDKTKTCLEDKYKYEVLKPNEEEKIPFIFMDGYNYIELKFTWDDEYEKNREYKQRVQIINRL